MRLLPDGHFEVTAGAASAGQGHETVFAQVAAEALAVPFDQVHYVPGDTERLPDGVGTFASRSAILAGSAVHKAAGALIELATERVDSPVERRTRRRPVRRGAGFTSPGTTRSDWVGTRPRGRGGRRTRRVAVPSTSLRCTGFRP